MAADPPAVLAAYVTEICVPAPVVELQRLHLPMSEPEPDPEAEL